MEMTREGGGGLMKCFRIEKQKSLFTYRKKIKKNHFDIV